MFKKMIIVLVLAKAILMIGLAIYPPVISEGCGVICDNIMMIPIMGFILLSGYICEKLIERRKLADLHRKVEIIKANFLKSGFDLSDPLKN